MHLFICKVVSMVKYIQWAWRSGLKLT
jgi:hypothetical protein